MAEFIYYNTHNASTGHTPFKLYCGYHPKVSFDEDLDSRSKTRSTDKLAEELWELMEVCYQNLLHVQKLQKGVHNERVKSCSYALGKKIWLNSK